MASSPSDMFARIMMSGMGARAAVSAPDIGRPPQTPAEKAAMREQLIAQHDRHLQSMVQTYGVQDLAVVQTSLSHDAKPASEFASSPKLDSCAPIYVADLRPGVTHTGRVLRGRLLVVPVLMTGLSTLLEDEHGDVVRVSVYNMLPAKLGGMAGLRAGARALPVGQAVAIVEPFYKIMADGSPGVRVDNPKEVVLLDSLVPPDAAALQADGRCHFAAARYDAAAGCYRRALLRMPDAGGAGTDLLSTLLVNTAASYLKLEQPARALQCAAAAAAVRQDSAGASAGAAYKAHYRSALALARLGHPLAARCALHRASPAAAGSGGGDRGAGAGAPGGPSWDDWRQMVGAVEELGVAQAGSPPSAKQVVQGREVLLRALSAIATLDGAVPDQAVAAATTTEPSSSPSVAGAAAEADPGRGTNGAAGASASTLAVVGEGAVGAALAAAAAAKQMGNEAFGQDRPDEALRHYLRGLQALRGALPAATLLANLAACGLQLSEMQQALAAATAAAVLEPTNAKSHHRRALALLQLGWLEEAEAACSGGLAAVAPGAVGHDALQGLLERICTAKAEGGGGGGKNKKQPRSGKQGKQGAGDAGGRTAEGGGGGGAGQGGAFHATERQLQSIRAPSGSAEELSLLNMMTNLARVNPQMAASMEKLRREDPLTWMAMQPNDRVPPFHQEFSKAGRWPAQCDLAECQRRLWDAYETCVGMAQHLLGMTSLVGCDPLDICTQRLGFIGHEVVARMVWLNSAPDGAVSFRSSYSQGYNPTIFHSFANASMPTVPMPPPGAGDGAAPRTHVAVGFVDLGTLAAAVGLAEWDEQVKAAAREGTAAAASPGADGGGGGGSRCLLRWVGYEASPYSVAKTTVMERMLRKGPSATDHVLQVSYSSAWTQDAHSAFREALTQLLKEHQSGAGGGAMPDAVLSYLRHWQQYDVGLSESRRRWLADWKRSFSAVGQFKEKADRMALCEYLLTGQLPGLSGGKLVGSVVMFATPKGGAERSLDECFLQALPPDELMAARLGSGGGGDIVSAGVALLRRSLQRLASLLASGRVEVQLHLRAVEPRDATTLSAISALRPATISWSNVPDYYAPKDFHAMARACSASASASSAAAAPPSSSASTSACSPTVHHMVTMNWAFDVKGASHLDLLMPHIQELAAAPGRGGRSGKKTELTKRLSKQVLTLFEDGKRAVDGELTRNGGRAARLQILPPIDNPRNVVDFGLFLKYYKNWVNDFFAAGGLRFSGGCRAEVTAPPTYDPLTRTNTTVGLAFSYGAK